MRPIRIALTCAFCLFLMGCEDSSQALYDWALDFEKERAEVTEKRIDVAGFDIALLVNDWQEERATLVMVHGFGANKESWLRMAKELTGDYNLLLIDLPAHGASSQAMDRNYSLNNQVSYLKALLDELAPPSPILIGSSMGGAITAALASQETPSGLILFNPAGLNAVESEFSQALQEGRNHLIPRTEEEFEQVIDMVMAKPPFVPWPIDSVLAEDAVKRQPMRERVFADLIASADEVDFPVLLTQIEAPTLVIWGDEDRIIHPGNAEAFVEKIPSASQKLFPGLGHLPMLEDPEASAETVDTFVQTLLPPNTAPAG